MHYKGVQHVPSPRPRLAGHRLRVRERGVALTAGDGEKPCLCLAERLIDSFRVIALHQAAFRVANVYHELSGRRNCRFIRLIIRPISLSDLAKSAREMFRGRSNTTNGLSKGTNGIVTLSP